MCEYGKVIKFSVWKFQGDQLIDKTNVRQQWNNFNVFPSIKRVNSDFESTTKTQCFVELSVLEGYRRCGSYSSLMREINGWGLPSQSLLLSSVFSPPPLLSSRPHPSPSAPPSTCRTPFTFPHPLARNCADRSTPYAFHDGTVGLYFMGFCRSQAPLIERMEAMYDVHGKFS